MFTNSSLKLADVDAVSPLSVSYTGSSPQAFLMVRSVISFKKLSRPQSSASATCRLVDEIAPPLSCKLDRNPANTSSCFETLTAPSSVVGNEASTKPEISFVNLCATARILGASCGFSAKSTKLESSVEGESSFTTVTDCSLSSSGVTGVLRFFFFFEADFGILQGLL